MRENIRQINSGLYVAADGNWGDAASMSIIDDRNWVEEDYKLLDAVDDGERADLAEAISMWISDERPDLGLAETRRIFGATDVADALLARYLNK